MIKVASAMILLVQLPSAAAPMGAPPEGALNMDAEPTQYTETYDANGDAYHGTMKGPECGNENTKEIGGCVKDGVGRYTFEDNTDEKPHYFDGQWLDNKKHGLGRYAFPAGGDYDGEWANDKQNGFGTYTW